MIRELFCLDLDAVSTNTKCENDEDIKAYAISISVRTDLDSSVQTQSEGGYQEVTTYGSAFSFT